MRSPVLMVAKSLTEFLTREETSAAAASGQGAGEVRRSCDKFYAEMVDDVRLLCKGLRSVHRQLAASLLVVDQRSIQRAMVAVEDGGGSSLIGGGRSHSFYQLYGEKRRSTSSPGGARKKSTVRGTCRKSTVGSSQVRRLTPKSVE